MPAGDTTKPYDHVSDQHNLVGRLSSNQELLVSADVLARYRAQRTRDMNLTGGATESHVTYVIPN